MVITFAILFYMKKKLETAECIDIRATDLTRGKAPAMLRDIENNGAIYLVIKNSKRCAVVMSYEEYIELVEKSK